MLTIATDRPDQISVPSVETVTETWGTKEGQSVQHHQLASIPEEWDERYMTVILSSGHTYYGQIDLHGAKDRINLYSAAGCLTVVDERYANLQVVCMFIHGS